MIVYKFLTLLLNCLLSLFSTAPQPPPQAPQYINPCVPSPCGSYSECRDIGGSPSCSCRPSYIGSPPNCRPECVIHQECASHQACMREKCRDPCPGSCGTNAQCQVVAHVPICSCLPGYTGDSFTGCHPIPPRKTFFLK